MALRLYVCALCAVSSAQRGGRRPAAKAPRAKARPAYETIPEGNQTLEQFRRVVHAHLDPGDYAAFERVTGGTVENLLAAPRWRGPAEKQLLRDCMSVDKKFVFHRLNAEGLHVLRVLVSKRVSEYVRESRRASLRFGAVAAEEACDDSVFNATFYAKRLIDEGIIIVPDAHRISPTTRDMLRGRSGFVRRVLEAASGFHKIEISEFGKVAIFTHGVKDVQNYMHSDTFQPTWKMWLFEPTAMGQGPFHYVPRSHLATEGRLRWIYDRTKGLVNANLVRLGNQYDDSVCAGPYSDRTHQFYSALRFLGFDYRKVKLSAEKLAFYAFAEPISVLTSAPLTLVIADTSGLHFRGWAPPGSKRMSATVVGPASPAMARKNDFLCEGLPDIC